MAITLIDFIVYFILFFIIPISIYLKKTGKTFIEMVKGIIEFFKGINE